MVGGTSNDVYTSEGIIVGSRTCGQKWDVKVVVVCYSISGVWQ